MNSSLQNTPPLLLDQMHADLNSEAKVFNSSDFRERKKLLQSLKKVILEHQERMEKAMFLDFKKPAIEVQLTEIYVLKSSINHILKNLREWMEAKAVPTPLALLGVKGYIKPEAKGSVLIISPWNYPFLLTIGPLACAIAAGNTVMLKPSESTPACCEVIAEIIEQVFSSKQVFVAKGDAEVSKHILKKKWDHLYYTGGSEVGKLVMKAASEHLTSVTLELGGKSPCIVDESADVSNAVKRIMWGKFLNGGQTCVAPDYLLVHEKHRDKLVAGMIELLIKMYPQNSPDMAGIVNQRHFSRLKEALDQATNQGANVLYGGGVNSEECRIEPTLVEKVQQDCLLMSHEIFGPILPIITFKNKDECFEIINNKPHPLALYIFSRSIKNTQEYISKCKAGTTAINTVVLQFNHPELPFGGIGGSGLGKGHGKFGFDEFSNQRSFVHQKIKYSALDLVRAPYTKVSALISKLTIKYL